LINLGIRDLERPQKWKDLDIKWERQDWEFWGVCTEEMGNMVAQKCDDDVAG